MRSDEIPESLMEIFKDTCVAALASGSTANDAIREGLAAVLTMHQQEVQEKVAEMIETVVGEYPHNAWNRPKFERGGFLNDWQWAAQLARWGYPRG